jgi:hypothetical protein
MNEPKVFISYSWSSSHHQEMVKYWADRLIADGIDVIIDIYDLNEGDNKYTFMESMVTDSSVTHVLVICDAKYAEKADSRTAGVGTESQIISSEVYKKGRVNSYQYCVTLMLKESLSSQYLWMLGLELTFLPLN